MSKIRYVGQAPLVAQVVENTVDTYDAATTYSLTIGTGVNVVTVSAIAAGSVSLTASAIQSAFNASTSPYKAGITIGVVGATVTLTGTAGVPFTYSFDDSGGTGAWDTPTDTAAASGPNIFNLGANWFNADTGFEAPSSWSAADDVFIGDSDEPLLFGLDQSSVTINSLTIESTYRGAIGLNPLKVQYGVALSDVNDGLDYREDYLAILVDVGVTIDAENATRIKINTGTTATKIKVVASGASTDADQPTVRLLCNSATTDIDVLGGSVGLGVEYLDESQTIVARNVTVHRSDNVQSPELFIGEGAALTLLKVESGEVEDRGRGTITTADLIGGRYVVFGHVLGKTITNLNVGGASLADLRQALAGVGLAVTVTNCTIHSGSTLYANKSVVFTNGVILDTCRIADVTIDLGADVTLTRS